MIEATKMIKSLRKELKNLSNKKRAETLQRFFKTNEGEYGYGDVFLGITVPDSRRLAVKYKDLSFDEITDLLRSEIHEERLIALLILVHQFQKEEMLQRRIYEFYLKHTKFVNNWDLVDLSSDKIVGGYLIDKPKDILYKLAQSENIWERRIAIIATYNFIKNNKFSETLKIAEMLISDKNDLIQKALGWMLREVGNRDMELEVKFLKKHYNDMGRTALRYSIEKFPEKVRKSYLLGAV